MPVLSARSEVARNFSQMYQETMTRNTKAICPKCKGSSAMRIQRHGFLQESVLAHFGIYPWKCGACGSLFLYRSRGHRARRSKIVHQSSPVDPNQDSLF